VSEWVSVLVWCVCARACVCACVCARVRVCACMCVSVCVCVWQSYRADGLDLTEWPHPT